jgi:methionyl-tRNA formyltransferase
MSSNIKLGIFLCAPVGYGISKFLNERREQFECVVFDKKDKQGCNDGIIKNFDYLPDSKKFYSDELESDRFLDILDGIDIIILGHWPYIIKEPLLSAPKIGLINLHSSFLPHTRGTHYYYWNIVEEGPYGVTIHWVNKDIDAGDIAFQTKIDKGWTDTGQTIYEKGKKEIVELFENNFDNIKNNNIPRIKQQEGGSFHLSKELRAASKIELDKKYTARELINMMRGLSFQSDFGTWFEDDGQEYYINMNINKREGSK